MAKKVPKSVNFCIRKNKYIRTLTVSVETENKSFLNYLENTVPIIQETPQLLFNQFYRDAYETTMRFSRRYHVQGKTPATLELLESLLNAAVTLDLRIQLRAADTAHPTQQYRRAQTSEILSIVNEFIESLDNDYKW